MTPARRLLAPRSTALLLAALAGCGARPAETEPTDEVAIGSGALREGSVVAIVNGAPITADRLLEQARTARQTAREALQALIREELLAQEAARRGLRRDPVVRAAQARAMANLFLERDFRFTLADVPAAEVRRAYQLNQGLYQHPDLVRVSHILALFPRNAAPGDVLEAHRLARRVHEIAVAGRLSEVEFKQIAPLVEKEASSGIRIRAESLTTPRTGYTVEPFASAAFAMAKPGEVSPIVQTRFGFHVIYLAERLPAVHRPLEDPTVDREIREKIFEDTRKQAFLRYLAELEKRHRVELHASRLSRGATAEVTP